MVRISLHGRRVGGWGGGEVCHTVVRRARPIGIRTGPLEQGRAEPGGAAFALGFAGAAWTMTRDDDDPGEGTPREQYPGPAPDAAGETQPGEDAAMREQQDAGAGDRPATGTT